MDPLEQMGYCDLSIGVHVKGQEPVVISALTDPDEAARLVRELYADHRRRQDALPYEDGQ